MITDSRLAIYNYVYDLVYDVVTKNVHRMGEPQELTSDEVKNGFVVIYVGSLLDESEFRGSTYVWARVFIEAYVPQQSRGRLNEAKYAKFEESLNDVIVRGSEDRDGDFYIMEDSVLSVDDTDESNANNRFYKFIKSFVVVADEQSQD